MRWLEYLRSAGGDLFRHKLRTLLTMLGIIFGVGAVISMLSIGAGAQAEALKVIDAMGLRNVIVREKPADPEDLYTTRERSLGLSLRDAEGLRRVATDIVAASPGKRIRSDRVLSEVGRSDGQVFGVGRSTSSREPRVWTPTQYEGEGAFAHSHDLHAGHPAELGRISDALLAPLRSSAD